MRSDNIQIAVRSMIFIFCSLFLIVGKVSAVNNLYISNVSAGPKSNVVLVAGVNNSDQFNSFQFDLIYPAELKWITDGLRLTSRARGHTVSAAIAEPGRLRIIAYSLINENFSGNSGSILEIDFHTGDQPGSFPLTIENAILNGNGGNILTSISGGIFTLSAPQLALSQATIDFGRVPLLKEEFRSVTITNTGNLDLVINTFTFSDARFSVSETLPLTLTANNSKALNIKFYSTVKGTLSNSLTINSNDPAGPKKCDLNAVAFAVNEIHIGAGAGRSGYDVEIPLTINNMEDFCALQLRIYLPSAAKFIKGSEKLDILRKTDHIISADTAGSILTILAYSPTNTKFIGDDGRILIFRLYLEGQGGDYSLPILDPVLSNSASENILSAGYGANVRITAPSISLNTSLMDFGNVSILESKTMDLIISNSGDDNLQINTINSMDPAFTILTPSPFNISSGANKSITIRFEAADGLLHSSIIRFRSNDVLNDPLDLSVRAKSFFPNEIRAIDCYTTSGSKDTIFVELFNQSNISGFQFDLEYPAGLTIHSSEIFLSLRKKDHLVIGSEISPGKLRILSYSGTLNSFTGTEGPILGIPVQVSYGISGTFPLLISGVVISDISSKSVETGFRSAGIFIDQPTAAENKSETEIKVYPNPVNEQLIIDFQGSSINELYLINLQGIEVFHSDVHSNPFVIATEMLKPGMYILILKGDNKSYFRKIAK